MILRPFFSYFGAKWRLARWYPRPQHRVLIEPFAGSAGYACRHFTREVRLFDTDPVIVGVWSWLLRAQPAEVLALPDLVDGQTVDDLAIPQEARWFVGFWLNKGNSRPGKSPGAWVRSGKYPNACWSSVIRERVASQLQYVRHWTVRLASFADVENTLATWFIDPPYSGAPGLRYRHHAVDFSALAGWCRARLGQTIACENAGASWLPFSPLVDGRALSGRTQEAIWIHERAA